MSSEREMARSLGAGVGKVIFYSGWRLQSPGRLGKEAGGTARSVLGSVMLGVWGFWAPSPPKTPLCS